MKIFTVLGPVLGPVLALWFSALPSAAHATDEEFKAKMGGVFEELQGNLKRGKTEPKTTRALEALNELMSQRAAQAQENAKKQREQELGLERTESSSVDPELESESDPESDTDAEARAKGRTEKPQVLKKAPLPETNAPTIESSSGPMIIEFPGKEFPEKKTK